MLVERGSGGRDSAAQVQGPRVAGRADGWRTALRPRGFEGCMGAKRSTTTRGPLDHLPRYVLSNYLYIVPEG